ncbi:MAG: hypothetical protein J6Q60_01135 [Bacteroidaceae bacterium]|nr:hypothetical protein [Bacteroidaceae bacterium]
MNYPVRCTQCISLLKNIKKYAHNRVYSIDKDLYIEVETTEEHNLIMQLNKHQEASLKIFINLNEL